jgi:TetR/AcrR family transcriptional regulator, transcriptional repressor for nem operon
VPRKSSRAGKAPKPRTKNARHVATRDDAKQQTRAAIVQAALELFAEQGLDVPSLDAICDRAGYTRGAFYVHFKTREDILVAVMDQVGSVFHQIVFAGLTADAAAAAAAGAAGGPVRARRLHHAVRRFIDAVGSGAYPLMATAGEGPLIRPHQLLDACARSPIVRERYRDLVQISLGAVSGLVQADQEDGEVRKDVDPQAVASIALALVIGAQTMRDLGLPIDPGSLASAIETMLTTNKVV